MFRFALVCYWVGILVLVGGVAPVGADIVVPGQKKVRRNTIVDFGSYADRATGSYKVRPGDTISALAKKHLGTVARQEEILALNPGLTPETLKAGATILMPPRVADAAQGWDFFAIAWGAHVERAFHRQPLYHHHYWTSLWAVPHEKTEEFLRRLAVGREKKREVIEALSKEPWIAMAKAKLCGYASLPDGSPIASIVETYTVQKIERGKVVLKKTSTQNLDKKRKPIAGAGLLLTLENGALLMLAVCGALGLGFLVRRRRVETRLEPVEVS